MRVSRALALLAVIAVAACGAPSGSDHEPADGADAASAPPLTPVPLVGTLEWALALPTRPDAERVQDAWRHPVATLEAFGVTPSDTIVEMWPSAGWWTRVLAPYTAQGGGRVIAARVSAGDEAARAFAQQFADTSLYGAVTVTNIGGLEPETADVVLAFDVVHAWMALGVAEVGFAAAYEALKPGGYMGVVAARAPDGGIQDPAATNGYVQTAFVDVLAREAGFERVEAFEINANPADDAEHPFGVWTLEPHRRTSALGQPPDPAFDRAPYDAIGAPDRMTILYRKPAAAAP